MGTWRRAARVSLIVSLLLQGGCNSHESQCERLVEQLYALKATLQAATGPSLPKTLDRVIFSLMRSQAELNALELPDPELAYDRRRVVKMLDGYLAALRAFAEVFRNNDEADAYELEQRVRVLESEERNILKSLQGHCRRGAP